MVRDGRISAAVAAAARGGGGVSGDDGARWAPAGRPSPDGDGGTLAATTTGQLAIATESAASWLFYSPNAGVGWRIVNQQDDGGRAGPT